MKFGFQKHFNRLTLSLWVTMICPGEIRLKFKNKAGEKKSELNNCWGKKKFSVKSVWKHELYTT